MAAGPHNERLNMSFEKWKKERLHEIEDLSAQMRKYPWDNKDFYAAWLAQTYYYVCHSTRLLAASAARFGVDQDDLHQRFREHMGEEKKHEALALKDLEALGYRVDQIGEWPATASFYQSQYYLIEHRDPRALLGYILMLEGLAVSVAKELHNRTSESFGKKASVFLKVHAEEDIGHLDSAFKFISGFDNPALRIISGSFEQSFFLYRQMLETCKIWSASKEKDAIIPHRSLKAA
jgi:hypothetical protein